MTREFPGEAELKAMWRRLGRLNHSQLLDAFRRAQEESRMRDGRMPRAEVMRELVMIWHLAQAWEEMEEREERLEAVA